MTCVLEKIVTGVEVSFMFSVVKQFSIFQVNFIKYKVNCYKVSNTDHCICSFSITVTKFPSLDNLERNEAYLPHSFEKVQNIC